MQVRALISSFCLLCGLNSSAQLQNELDSLLTNWNDASLPDTTRADSYRNYIMKGFVYRNPDTALILLDEHLAFSKKHNIPEELARNNLARGSAYYVKGEQDSSYTCMEEALNIAIKDKDELLQGMAYNNLGLLNKQKGNLPLALEYYNNAITLKKKMGDDTGAASSMSNVGVILNEQGNYEEALIIFEDVVDLLKDSPNQMPLGNTYTNMSICYGKLGNDSLRDIYVHKALNIWIQTDNKKGMANAHNNLGSIHEGYGNYDSAIYYYERSIEIYEEIGGKSSIPTSLSNLGYVYYKMGNLTKALSLTEEAWQMHLESPKLVNEFSMSKRLYVYYKEKGHYKKALEMLEIRIASKDSLNSMDAERASLRLKLNYEFENKQDSIAIEQKKQEEIALIEQQKKDEIAKADSQRKNILIGSILFVLLAVVIFAVIIRKRLRITREQKNVIEDQKKIVEHQKEEIVDSITYAQRIQKAILPTDALVNQLYPESFVLYLPKDIVAGDFYWMDQIGEHKFFAAADCTGHGVPGAMVSVICNNALNRCIREYELTDPGEILTKARELVIQEFAKADDDVKDGMDIALCVIKGDELKFSGAHNPLWIIRKGELLETKGDKQPVGNFEYAKPFQTRTLALEKGDMVYVFSDGYVDQFGGDKGKKFKSKNLKILLDSIWKLEPSEQKSKLEVQFHQWKSDFDQIDDVCLIGVRI